MEVDNVIRFMKAIHKFIDNKFINKYYDAQARVDPITSLIQQFGVLWEYEEKRLLKVTSLELRL